MYNSPGEDLEFLEFYNSSDFDTDLSGYIISDAINYSFPDTLLKSKATFVITNDSLKFQRFYGFSVSEWGSGALGNSGEQISVIDATGGTIVSMVYSDNQPWPQMADGGGASLTRCNVANDINLSESWDRSITLAAIEEGVDVYSSPGSYEGCRLNGRSRLAPSIFWTYVIETEGLVVMQYFLDNAPDTTSLFLVTAEPMGSVEGDDYILLTDTLEFSSVRSSVQNVEIQLIDDGIDELAAEFIRVIVTPINNDVEVHPVPAIINIIDCKSSSDSKLKIGGVIHSPEIKAVELIVLDSINVSESYGIGSANNGNGSNGQEFLFRKRAAPGDCLYVTNDTIRFKEFFGPIDNDLLIQDEELEADFNGNDAIELFHNCKVVDTYGFADEDGSGTVWDYNDGWAKKVDLSDTSSPSNFDPDAWEYSTPNGLDATTNDSSTVPFPLSCFMTDTEDLSELADVSIYPNPSDGLIYIDTALGLDRLTITNRLGQVVYQTKNLSRSARIDLLTYSTTLLFIHCEYDGKRTTKKIIVN